MVRSSPAPVATRDHWAARVAWSIVSQGLSSATNFGLTVLLAVATDAESFGRTVAALSVYLFALTLGRSLVTERLVAAADGDRSSPLAWIPARDRLLLLSVPAAVATVAVGVVVGVDRVILVVLPLALPLLLVQDGQRYGAWATGRPGAATGLDAWWLGCSATMIGAAVAVGPELTPRLVVAAWAIGGSSSWVVGRLKVEPAFTTSPPPSDWPDNAATPARQGPVSSPQPWWAAPESAASGSQRYRALAGSQALAAAAFNLGPVAVAMILSPTLTAAMKLVLLPFTALLSLFGGLRVVTLPATRRAIDRGGEPAGVRMLIGASCLVAAVAAAVTVRLVGAMPSERLANSLSLAEPYLPWGAALSVLYVVGQQLADGAAMAGAPVVGRRAVALAVEWTGLAIGGAVAGIAGLLAGWTIGLALATVLWLWTWSTAAGPTSLDRRRFS